MTPIEYFKLQAKKLHKDYKTQTTYIDEVDGNQYFRYSPKFFDIDGMFLDYDYQGESNFTLMKAQHFVAQMVGFYKWGELLKASAEEQKLARLLFEHQNKISFEEWEMYIARTEIDNNTKFSTADQIEILKKVFIEVDGHFATPSGYIL